MNQGARSSKFNYFQLTWAEDSCRVYRIGASIVVVIVRHLPSSIYTFKHEFLLKQPVTLQNVCISLLRLRTEYIKFWDESVENCDYDSNNVLLD